MIQRYLDLSPTHPTLLAHPASTRFMDVDGVRCCKLFMYDKKVKETSSNDTSIGCPSKETSDGKVR